MKEIKMAILAVFMLALGMALLLFVSDEAEATPGSITLNWATVTLTNDADGNGICNIGDTITVTANITNTDGDNTPPDNSTVQADLSQFGAVGLVPMMIEWPEEGPSPENWTGTYMITENPGTPNSGPGMAIGSIWITDNDDNVNGPTSPLLEAVDCRRPTGTISCSVDPIYEIMLVQTVTVTYDEPMDTLTSPVITLTGANWGPQTPAPGWTAPDTYVATFTHDGTQEEIPSATANIASASGATDTGGNDEHAASSPQFEIDTKKPTPTITCSVNPINESTLVQTVTVTYDEQMDPFTSPVIILSGTNWGPQNSLGWSGGFTVFTATFTHNGAQEKIAAANASIVAGSGATDIAGNAENSGVSLPFVLDTQKPTPSIVCSVDPIYENDWVQTVTVTYDEPMDPLSSPVITFATSTHFTSNGDGAWGMGNTVWTETFTHDLTQEEIPAETANIAASSGANDTVGNAENGNVSSSFVIDTQKPIPTISVWQDINTVNLGQIVWVDYDEPMNTSTSPNIQLSGTHWSPPFGQAWTSPTRYEVRFDHDGTPEEFTCWASLMVGGGAKDVAGNEENVAAPEPFTVDTKRPTPSIICSVDPIYEGALVQTVTVTYDEPMDPMTFPTITFATSTHFTSNMDGGWGVGNTVWTETFTHDGTPEEIPADTADIIAFGSARDAPGNNQENGNTSNTFVVDTQKPTPSIVCSVNPIYEGALIQTVTVTYDEPMDALTSPVIILTGTNWGPQNSLGWSGGFTVFTATFTHNGAQEHILNTFASIVAGSGAADVAGNDENGNLSIPFIVDTRKPATILMDSGTVWWNGSNLIVYESDHSISLLGNDFGGTGIALIEYNIDSTGWTPYGPPFSLTGLGWHTLEYRSTDNAGNVELINIQSIYVATDYWTGVHGGGTYTDGYAFACNVTLTGDLTLTNYTVIMNSTPSNTQYFDVKPGVTLIIQDGDNNPATIDDESMFTNIDNMHYYYMHIKPTASITIRYSSIEYCGYVDVGAGPPADFSDLGLYINNATANLIGPRLYSPQGCGVVFYGDSGNYNLDGQDLTTYYRLHDSVVGFAIVNADNVLISSTYIEGANLWGGYVNNSMATITSNNFTANGANIATDFGGGIYLVESTVDIGFNEFYMNDGVGLVVENTDITINDCTFTNNNQLSPMGWAEALIINNIDLGIPIFATFDNNVVYNNMDDVGFMCAGAIAIEAYDNNITTLGNVAIGLWLGTDYAPIIDIPYLQVYENDIYGWEGIIFNLNKYNPSNASSISIGNFDIYNNTFDTSQRALNLFMDCEGSNPATIGDIIVDNNEVIGAGGFKLDILFEKPLSGSDFVFGQTVITNNKLYNTDTGIDIDRYRVYDMSGGSVTWGDILIKDNFVNCGNDQGIFFYGYVENLTNVNVALGKMDFSDNNVTSFWQGVYMDWWDIMTIYGTTIVTAQDACMNNNTVASQYEGIYLQNDNVDSIYDSASITTGDFYIYNNTITVTGSNQEGIYIDMGGFGYGIYNDSSFDVGNYYIDSNIINSSGKGIYFYINDCGRDMGGNAQLTVGDIHVTDNNVTSSNNGIDIEIGDSGRNMYGLTSMSFGNFIFNDNNISSGGNGINIEMNQVGYNMHDSASVAMGDFTIQSNNITSVQKGIYLMVSDMARHIHNDSIFTIGDFSLNYNTINSTTATGIEFMIQNSAYTMTGNASTAFGYFDILTNNITANNHGLWFGMYNIGFEMYDGAVVSLKDFYINDNTLDCPNGWVLASDFMWFGNYMYGNSSFSIGNCYSESNIILSGQMGIWTGPQNWGNYMYDNSVFRYGDFFIRSNVINVSLQSGIRIEYTYNGANMAGSSIVTGGNVTVTNNIVSSRDEYGLRFPYVQTGYDISDFAFVSTGWIDISYNNFSSVNNHGVCLSISYLGCIMYGNSQVFIGDIMFTHNNVWSDTEDSLHFMNFFANGYQMHDDTYFQIGNVLVNDNYMNAGGTGDGIELNQWWMNAYEMYQNASADFGNFEFQRNEIEANGSGIYGNDISEWGYLMIDNSSAIFGDFIFNENTINATGDGINIYAHHFGSNLNVNSSFSMGDWRLNNNTIDSGGNGMYFNPNYFGYEINDNSISIIGGNEIMHNDVNSSGSYGIFSSWWNFFAADLYDYSHVEVGDCHFMHNHVWMNGSSGVAIKCEPIWAGYIVDDNSSAYLGDYIVSNNWIYTEYDGIWIHFEGLGGNLENSNFLYTYAIAEIGDILVNNNVIIAPNYRGITIYYYNVVDALYYYSTSTIGFCQVRNNTIDSYNEALGIELKWEGYSIWDSAQGSIGRFEIDENNLNSTNGIGISISMWECFNTIRNNAQFSWDGIYITDNDIKAMREGIDIFIENSVDITGNAIADFPGFWITGNTVDSQLSAFNYTTATTPLDLEPTATFDWGDFVIENNTFEGGLFGMAMGWQDPNASIGQPMFLINNCDILGGLTNSTGFFLFDITDVYTENVTINGFNWGIHANNSNIHYMLNSTIVNCLPWNLKLTSASYIFMVNSTFDNTSVFFEDDSSLLEVGWFMNILVNSPLAFPISEANVTVADVDGTDVFNGTADLNGQVFNLICREYQENITGIVKNFNDYTANANKSGAFGSAIPNPTMNQTQQVIITLLDGILPTIFSDNSDLAGFTGDPFYFEINVTDNLGIVNVYVNYTYIGYGSYTNLTMMGSGPYWRIITIPGDFVGLMGYNFSAQDIGGNWINTTSKFVPITDNDEPIYIWDIQPTEGTTGESVLVSIFSYDNIGVTYYKIDIDGTLYDLLKDGDFYNFTIIIPPDDITNITYSIILNDSANNPNSTTPTVINVIDNDAPTLNADDSDIVAYTGDSFHLNFNITDNIGINQTNIIYWFGSDSPSIIVILGGYTDNNATILVPEDSLEILHYYVTSKDLAGNWLTSPQVDINVIDNDEPSYNWVSRPMAGIAGGTVNVSLTASDNIGIIYYRINIDGALYDMIFDGNFYNFTINIPPGSTADITYNITFNDSADNPITTPNTIIIVTLPEIEAPTYIWVLRPTIGTTGESVFVSLLAYDNTGITYYKIDIGGTLYDMIKDGDYYNFTINIPLDSTTDIAYNATFRDASSNSNSTGDTIINVTDNDEPTYVWILQPTAGATGESMVVSIMADDNIGITYCKINVSGTLYDMVNDGDYYNFTISIPPDDLASITYEIILNDNANNPNSTTLKNITVTDIEEPSYTWVLHPTSGTTGDIVLISILGYDNIGITYIKINVSGTLYNTVNDGDYYNFTISIPPDDLASITYEIILNDSANNQNSTSPTTITITDDDEPTFNWVLHPTTGITGESVIVSISANDNIGIIYAMIEIDGTLYDMDFDGNFFNYTIDIPSDSTASITYNITLNDSANNPLIIPDTVITVTGPDMEAPEYIWISQPTIGTTGDTVLVSLLATDNVGITYYKISIYGVVQNLVKDGDYYNFTIDIPIDSTASITYYVIFNDSANNPKASGYTQITVADDELPTDLVDTSDTGANTGDTFTFEVDASDNIGKSAVYVIYWFGTGSPTNATMTGTGPYTLDITIPSDSLDTMHYYFAISDAADNWLVGGGEDITITDNDLPSISNDASDTTGEQGKEFRFQIDASDNIGVSQVRVASWFGEDETQKKYLLLTETDGTYSGTITLGESGTLHYYFEVIDDSGNPLEGERKTVDIASKPKEEEGPNMALFILPIIVIVVLILLFLLMRKKKGEEIPAEAVEGEEPEEEIEPEEGLEEGEEIEGFEEGEQEFEEGEPGEEMEEEGLEFEEEVEEGPSEEFELEEEPGEEPEWEEVEGEEEGGEEFELEEEPSEELEPKEEAKEKDKESKSYVDMLSEDIDEGE